MATGTGIDTAASSRDYIHLYGGDRESLTQALDRIQRAASLILRAVMASEISGLPALRGYLKLGNLVVRLSVPFVQRPQIEAAFIERPRRRRLATATPDATPSVPAASQERGIQPSNALHQDYELK